MSNKTEAQKQIDRAERESLKQEFLTRWRQLNGPDLQEEFEFSPTRGWRFDFAHLPSLTAIEIEGGTWSGGRHTRGKGYSEDCQKYNAAVHLNWRLFRLTSDMLTNDPVGHLLPVIELMRS
jgi:hypothetical protein